MAQPVEFFLEKPKVKPYVMRHKNSPFGNIENLMGHLTKCGRIGHQLFRNARQVTNKGRNRTTRIE